MSIRPTRPRRAGYIYLPLDVEFMEDDRIAEVGEKAAWLYLGMCLRSKQLVSDGVLSARQVERLPITGTASRLRALLKVGLVVQDDGRYVIAAWRSYNSTATELQDAAEKRVAGAALGNHRRWHEERGVTDPTCDHCTDRSTDRPAIASESVKRSPSDSLSESPKTEREGEGEGETKGATQTNPPRPAVADPDGFAEFWAVYPSRVGRITAVKAYRKALKTTDAPTLLQGATRYRDDPARKPEFTAHASTWLNAGRWADEPAQPARPTGSVLHLSEPERQWAAQQRRMAERGGLFGDGAA